MFKQGPKELKSLFESERRVLVAYLFGSRATGRAIPPSDVDFAALLSDVSDDLLSYYLHLIDRISAFLGADVDIVVLNLAPPFLRYQVIKHANVVYCRDEASRVSFESRAVDEYLDFKRALERYDECLLKSLL